MHGLFHIDRGGKRFARRCRLLLRFVCRHRLTRLLLGEGKLQICSDAFPHTLFVGPIPEIIAAGGVGFLNVRNPSTVPRLYNAEVALLDSFFTYIQRVVVLARAIVSSNVLILNFGGNVIY